MEEDFARKKAKCIEAIKGIHLLMAKNRIPLPSKYQKSRVHEDLPFDPKVREGCDAYHDCIEKSKIIFWFLFLH